MEGYEKPYHVYRDRVDPLKFRSGHNTKTMAILVADSLSKQADEQGVGVRYIAVPKP